VYSEIVSYLSTSDQALLQPIKDAWHNIDVTTRHGKIKVEIEVSEKRAHEYTIWSEPTKGPEVLSTADTVVRRLHRR